MSAIDVFVSADMFTAFSNSSFASILATTGFVDVFAFPFPSCPDVPVPNPNTVPSVPTTRLWSSPDARSAMLLKYGIFLFGVPILYTNPFSPK